eukprot:jgi/Chrzof1/4629/Cz14g20170.t1
MSHYAMSTATTAQPPEYLRLIDIFRSFGPCRALTTAVKLDLFTLLRSRREQGLGGATGTQLGEALGLITEPGFRGTLDFFDLLVSIGTLDRTGVGYDAVYSNTPSADAFLSRQSDEYVGGLAMVNHVRSYPQFMFLEHSLKHGTSSPLLTSLVPDIRDTFAGDNADAFAEGMTGCNLGAFRDFAAKFDFSRYTTLGDFGGSTGVLCCCVAEKHQHMTCTTYDLPAVHNAAVKYALKQQLQNRVQVCDHDFFSNVPFPQSDIITMGMVLHDWGLPNKRLLIKKAFDALPQGGAFVAIEVLIDDERRHNTTGLFMSLNMLLEFGEEHAFDYTFQDFQQWTSEAGFSSHKCIHLVGPHSAAVAFK